MPKTKSSRRWMQRHVNDEFVQRAQREGYRSRAAYKLLELQERDRLIQPGQVVVDLGAAPGGWSQVAGNLVGRKGQVFAMDLLAMEPLPNVDFLQGDFREESVLAELLGRLDGRPVDVVISDMAPNITGTSSVDLPRAMYLCELALDFARQVLKPGGTLVMKVFQGEGFDDLIRDTRSSFKRVLTRKPKSSRPKSREVYLVAGNFES